MAEEKKNDIIPKEQEMDSNKTLEVFGNSKDFITAQRMAQALSQSTIVPKSYQGNISNTLIAIDIASRIRISPMLVMQNLYIVNGMPSWSSQFIIGVINNSKRYRKPLEFKMSGEGDSRECYCHTEDYEKNPVIGPVVSIKMAIEEGWMNKSGSKWKTMPEVMLKYRAASFFGRLYCSDILMGIYGEDEVMDMNTTYTQQPDVEMEIKAKANKQLLDIPDADIVEEDPEPQEQHQSQQKVESEKQDLYAGPGF